MDGNLAMNAHFENMSEEELGSMHEYFTALNSAVPFLKWVREKFQWDEYSETYSKMSGGRWTKQDFDVESYNEEQLFDLFYKSKK